MRQCPECGMDYNEDDDCQGGYCGGCGWNPTIDRFEECEAKIARVNSIADGIANVKKKVIPRMKLTNEMRWKIKMTKDNAIASFDRSNFKAVIVFDEIIVCRVEDGNYYDEDGDSDDVGKAVISVQKYLDGLFGHNSGCVCRAEHVYDDHWEELIPDVDYFCVDYHYYLIIVESSIHKENFELLKDIAVASIASNLKLSNVSFEKIETSTSKSFDYNFRAANQYNFPPIPQD